MEKINQNDSKNWINTLKIISPIHSSSTKPDDKRDNCVNKSINSNGTLINRNYSENIKISTERSNPNSKQISTTALNNKDKTISTTTTKTTSTSYCNSGGCIDCGFHNITSSNNNRNVSSSVTLVSNNNNNNNSNENNHYEQFDKINEQKLQNFIIKSNSCNKYYFYNKIKNDKHFPTITSEKYRLNFTDSELLHVNDNLIFNQRYKQQSKLSNNFFSQINSYSLSSNNDSLRSLSPLRYQYYRFKSDLSAVLDNKTKSIIDQERISTSAIDYYHQSQYQPINVDDHHQVTNRIQNLLNSVFANFYLPSTTSRTVSSVSSEESGLGSTESAALLSGSRVATINHIDPVNTRNSEFDDFKSLSGKNRFV